MPEVNLYLDLLGVKAVAFLEMDLLTEARLRLEVGERDPEDEEKSTEQRFREVLEDLHRTLAFFGIGGKIAIPPLRFSSLDDEDREAAQRALDFFPEDFFTITQEDTARVIAEVRETAQQDSDDLKWFSRTLQEQGLSRGLNKEERRNATLGELFDLRDKDEED